MKHRLDHLVVARELVTTRSQAESYIRLGVVKVDGKVQTKPGYFVDENAKVGLHSDQYVSRAGLKLASVAMTLKLDFKNKVVLDVGSSTGGFTDYALQHGAKKVVAVDIGTNQLHPKLRKDERVELHEQTDVRDVDYLAETPDIIVIDVSFISLRDVLPHLATLSTKQTQIVAMLKPQFEAGKSQTSVYSRGLRDQKPMISRRESQNPTRRSNDYVAKGFDLSESERAGSESQAYAGSRWKHKGVIKNDRIRRDVLKDFETWTKKLFIIKDKSDSLVHGEKGNSERFYLLNKL